MKLFGLLGVLLCLSSVIGEDVAEMDGYNYLLSAPMKADWQTANQYCRYRGMYLVDIPTYMEQKRLVSIIKRFSSLYNNTNTELWTSGSDAKGNNGNFVWMSSGHSFLFTYFADGQPDKRISDSCVSLYHPDKFYWKNMPCEVKLYFICRSKVIDPTIVKAGKSNDDLFRPGPYPGPYPVPYPGPHNQFPPLVPYPGIIQYPGGSYPGGVLPGRTSPGSSVPSGQGSPPSVAHSQQD